MDLAAFTRDYGLLVLSAVVALFGATWAAFRWAAHKEFATKLDVAQIYERMSEMARVFKDEQQVQDVALLKLEHQNELRKKDIENLPGFTEFNTLKDSVSGMETKLATQLTKLDTLVSTVEGINDFLRRTPYERPVGR
jgi:hypothetical protein